VRASRSVASKLHIITVLLQLWFEPQPPVCLKNPQIEITYNVLPAVYLQIEPVYGSS